MLSTGWSSISRNRAVLAAVLGLGAAGGIFYILYTTHHLYDPPQNTSNTQLRRSNAVRRSRIRSRHDRRNSAGGPPTEDQLQSPGADPLSSMFDDAATEVSAANDDLEGQNFKELMFAIAKHRAQNEGIVHRGVTCDNCNRAPIVGVRYHCSNCADFDLCEDCEAMDCHIKTHVFYKVKIPAPWGGKQPLQLWYPGRPRELPDVLPAHLKKDYEYHTGFSGNKLEGWYQQFACLANVRYPEDPDGLRMAIDRQAFDCCFVPQQTGKKFPTPNLVHDRLFREYDRDRIGMIGFRAFILTIHDIQSDDNMIHKRRVFHGLDFDEDGYVTRKDFLRMFKACHNLKRAILLDYMKADNDAQDNLMSIQSRTDHVVSGRPLAVYFNHDGRAFGPNPRATDGKPPWGSEADVTIDPVKEDADDTDTISRKEVIGQTWNPFQELQEDLGRIGNGVTPIWLNHDDARSFDTSQICEDSNWGEADGSFWVQFYFQPARSVFIRILRSDVDDWSESWRPEFGNQIMANQTLSSVCARLTKQIGHELRENSDGLLARRAKLRQFHLEGEKNTFANESDPAKQQDTMSIENTTNDTTRQSDTAMDDQDNSNQFTPFNSSLLFTGGMAASNTIYTVIQQALNELLDPLFFTHEELSVAADAAAEVCLAHRLAIQHYRLKEMAHDILQEVRRAPDEPAPAGKPDIWTILRSVEYHFNEPARKNIWLAEQSAEFVEALTNVFSRTPEAGSMTQEQEGKAMQQFLSDSKVQEILSELAAWEPSSLGEVNQAITIASIQHDDHDLANGAAIDPTLPQNRPNASAPNPTSDGEYPSASNDKSHSYSSTLAQLETLVRFDNDLISRERKPPRPPGSLDFTTFEAALETTDDEGRKLLDWVSGWLKISYFA